MKEKYLALAMICKGTKEEIKSLDTCLSSVAQFVDDVFITLTYTDKESDVDGLKKYLEDNWNAKVSTFKWIKDFAAARNHNFAQVPKDFKYILWLDADDALRGASDLKDTMKENEADVYILNYIYAIDEDKNPTVVHMKTQIVKNDGCVSWVGKLHEDFDKKRELKSYLIKDIDRIHLSTDERFEEAKTRNLEVAEDDVRLNPKDPRSYWNLANSLKALGDNKALEVFKKFMSMSKSEEEMYIVRLRVAEIHWTNKDFSKAIDECRYAIGLRPRYPDAYHLMANVYHDVGKYDKAVENHLIGLRLKPPYHSIIVYNPRDYDFVPMNNLAKTFFSMGRPDLALPMLEACLKISPRNAKVKEMVTLLREETNNFNEMLVYVKELEATEDKEELYKKLQAIPDKFKSIPQICRIRNKNFIKEESTGKDIVYYCGFTQEEWTPETAKKKGIGGSEEAVIWLSKMWAKKGYNVTVYNNCGHKEKEFDGVKFKPFWTWNPRDKQDVTILWRTPRMAQYELNTGKLIVDLHDVISPGEFTEERLAKIDKVFVKSKVHKDLFPDIPEDKFVVVPNGIDSELFDLETKKDPYLLLNTSSPDRSLGSLVDLFAEVKKQVPEAKCKWAYGWGVFDVVHGDNKELMDWKTGIQKKMKETGIEELGRISHGEVAKLYKKARIFAYPSEFFEIDCISLSKSMASGCIPVTTDFAAMGEKSGNGGYFIHSEKTSDNWCPSGTYDFGIKNKLQRKEWVEKVVMLLKNQPEKEQLEIMSNWARKTFDWRGVANKWITNFIK